MLLAITACEIAVSCEAVSRMLAELCKHTVDCHCRAFPGIFASLVDVYFTYMSAIGNECHVHVEMYGAFLECFAGM